MAIKISNKTNTPVSAKSPRHRDFTKILTTDLSLLGKLGNASKLRFFGALQSTISAGLDTSHSLGILESGLKKGKLLLVAQQLQAEMLTGALLSEAMARTRRFDNYEIQSIRLAEETGKMVDVLTQLQNYYAGKVRLKRQMLNILSYPLFVVVFAIGVLSFMISFIVPVFEDLFAQFNTELPALTQNVLLFADNFWLILTVVIGAIGLIVGAFWANRENPDQRRILSTILIRIPIFGPLIRKIYVARFCQIMALLQSARMPLVDSLELIKTIIPFYPIQKAMEDCENKITVGHSLHKALSGHSIFDPRVIALVQMGEEVNKMDEVFEQLSADYSEMVENESAIVGKIVEPLIIILVASIVGVILLAMYMPIFNMSNIF